MKYSYRCPECGVFTLDQSIKDEPISECPSCGQPVKRIIGKNINVIYRTTGFYNTDHGSACASADSMSDSCASCEHYEAHKDA